MKNNIEFHNCVEVLSPLEMKEVNGGDGGLVIAVSAAVAGISWTLMQAFEWGYNYGQRAIDQHKENQAWEESSKW